MSKIFYKLFKSAALKSSEHSAKPFLFNCPRVEMRHTLRFFKIALRIIVKKIQLNKLPFLSKNDFAFGSSAIAFNVLALGAVADFGALNCKYNTKVDAR